jgi:hypothetical protein
MLLVLLVLLLLLVLASSVAAAVLGTVDVEEGVLAAAAVGRGAETAESLELASLPDT